MSLLDLKPYKGAKKKTRRVGRGQGSGRGTYAGRGGKGQKARSGGTIRPGFEGGQTPIFRRIPKFRGFKNPSRTIFQIVNVKNLEIFNNGDTVTITELFEKNLIRRKNQPVKILGNGELTKNLQIKVDRLSSSAKEKITAAKGSFTELMQKEEKKEEPINITK